MAGIRPSFDAPGFQEFGLKPIIGGSLTWAEASYQTQYGLIRSRWEKNGDRFIYSCTVPEGTTAHLTLPDGKTEVLHAGNYRFEGGNHGSFSI